MDATKRNSVKTWEELQTRLAGSFTARTRGFLAAELVLSGPAGEFGRVRSHASGAEVTAGPLSATIEQIDPSRYRMMLTDGTAPLAARPAERSADGLEMLVYDRLYEARISFFRSRAVVTSREGEEILRLKGNLTGRRYKAAFDPETPGALLAAILLLYHIVIHRSRAFRAG